MGIADSPSGRSRRTIGVITSSFGDPYAGLLVAGVTDVMVEHDVNLICFAGGRPGSPHDSESGGGVLYDLAGAQNIDGVLLMSGALVHFLGQDLLEQFAKRYRALPLVTVAAELPDRPCVMVDSEAGLRDVLEHLIDVHGHRRIGFIRGPRQSAEAEIRYRVFGKVMAERGLAVDPSSVVEGAFDPISGAAAARLLFAERNLGLHAVVAANDQMAIAAMETLKALGLDVPRDVAVVGFDDTELSGFVTPALTTVKQPLYRLGEHAARTLLASVEGRPVPPRLVLATQAVIRESCGCSPKLAHAVTLPPRGLQQAHWRARLLEAGARIADEMLQSVDSPALRPADWRGEVLAALAEELDGGDTFVPALESLLARMSSVGEDVWPWQKVLVTLRTSVGPWLAGEPLERAENAWHRAEVLVADVSRRVQAQKRVLAERRGRTLGQISQALISTIDMGELAAVVARGLPELQLRNCFVALYEDPTHPTAWSRMVLASTELGQVELSADGRFPSRLLVPPGTFPDRRYTMVAEALYFKEHQLGYVLFEVDSPEGPLFEEIRQQLSSALMRVKREAELKALHVAERTRTAELEHAYQVMKDNQQKLLISEKMAALGRLTAGMAHEMNTPLAAVRMALEELDKLAGEYGSAAGDPNITAEDHAEIAGEMQSAIRLAINAAEKVASFIHGIKFQTRDISRREHRSFNAVPVVQDTLVLLHHAMRKSNCTVTFEPSTPLIQVHGAPGRLAQLVTNLVTNAIDASRAKGGGEIVLSLARDLARGEVELSVRDRGAGIPAEIVKRIFDPMFTTKPFGEGTGLGLSIVHDIVTSDFKGSIEVDTEVDQGTTFKLRLQAGEGETP